MGAHTACPARVVCVVVLVALGGSTSAPQTVGDLRATIKRVKPSVVGFGTFYPTRQPRGRLLGTAFVVGEGRRVLTTAHLLQAALADEGDRHGRPPEDFVVVFVPEADGPSFSHVTKLSEDSEHDVALLQLTAKRLPPMSLGDDGGVEEGQTVAFTGFPIGAVLGLHPVTHQGIVSAITPVAKAASHARDLANATIDRLRHTYSVFQLDAIAYPGNSGSPLYDPVTGEVYGIVNSVFVKTTKESALTDPSGISYAIPIRFARALLEKSPRSPD